MTRMIGPDAGYQLVYRLSGGVLTTAASVTAVIYSDQACTIPADILDLGGVPIPASRITVGTDSQLPLFQFPDGVRVLYTSVGGGPAVALYARSADLSDAVQAAAITAAATDATTKADGARDAAVALSAQRAANLSDLASASTSRTNLGLGGAAVLSVGTTPGTVAAGNDARITGAAASVDVQKFLTPGNSNWTKPVGAKLVTVYVIAGGGGGGSGRRTASATAASGGAGGGGGGWSVMSFTAADLGATELVQVGAGGVGGAAVTVDSTNGNNGGNGTASAFGNTPTRVRGAFGTQGLAGGTAAATQGFGGGGIAPGANGAGAGVGVAGSGGGGGNGGAPGGGAGGGISVTPVAFAGGAAGGNGQTNSGGPAGGAIDANGINGTSIVNLNQLIAGTAGSGGGASITIAGGTGGNGGAYGAGGGGGGASLNGQPSGAGGSGAPGAVMVITYF